MEPTRGQRLRLAEIPMPPRVGVLPRTKEGYPIPWFVPTLEDGTRDLRVMGEQQWISAITDQRCWVCGQRLGVWKTFLIGPMCCVNRITAEPPSHRECAEYSAVVCPFVSRPSFERRTAPLPEGSVPPAGLHSDANPGVSATWSTKSFTVFRVPRFTSGGGARPGRLISIGPPSEVKWWHEGRPASAAAAEFALEAGLATLRDAAAADNDPELALMSLEGQYRLAKLLLPKG